MSDTSMRELYQEVILDHNKNPRNYRVMDDATRCAEGNNPLCGDQLHVSLRLQGDRLVDVRFEGRGCAISVASASLMSEAVKGHTRAEVDALYHRVHALLTGERTAGAEELGKLASLGGVAEYPASVKCASLCWHTLHAALTRSDAPVSTE